MTRLAILRAAALLVPGWQRREWFGEWRAELWHAEQTPEGSNVTAFCLGAFKDALWLRRNGPIQRSYGILQIESPPAFPEPPHEYDMIRLDSQAHCLSFLAACAALCLSICFLLPAARHAILPPPYLGAHIVFLLPNMVTACLIVWLTSSLSLGEYPRNAHSPSLRIRLRRWVFLAAKTALMAAIVFFGVLDLACLGSSISMGILMHAHLWGSVFALRWVLQDQRLRCPVCLRRLANPVRIGQSSHIFLEWSGTELVCLQGHGLLHVPEHPAIWFTKQRWLYLDPSWAGLFP